jgi:hypothetical protein
VRHQAYEDEPLPRLLGLALVLFSSVILNLSIYAARVAESMSKLDTLSRYSVAGTFYDPAIVRLKRTLKPVWGTHVLRGGGRHYHSLKQIYPSQALRSTKHGCFDRRQSLSADSAFLGRRSIFRQRGKEQFERLTLYGGRSCVVVTLEQLLDVARCCLLGQFAQSGPIDSLCDEWREKGQAGLIVKLSKDREETCPDSDVRTRDDVRSEEAKDRVPKRSA